MGMKLNPKFIVMEVKKDGSDDYEKTAIRVDRIHDFHRSSEDETIFYMNKGEGSMRSPFLIAKGSFDDWVCYLNNETQEHPSILGDLTKVVPVMEKMAEENESLRKELRSVLETFKVENAKMEDAISDILYSAPPGTAEGITSRLRTLGLVPKQIERILAAIPR